MLKDELRIAIEALSKIILQNKDIRNLGAPALTWDSYSLVFMDFDRLRISLFQMPKHPTHQM